MQNVQPLWKTEVLQFLLKVNIYLPKLTFEINCREMKTDVHMKTYMNVYSSFIHDIPHYTQLSCPSVGEWLNKLWWLVHHSMECYSTIKRGNLLIYMHQPE